MRRRHPFIDSHQCSPHFPLLTVFTIIGVSTFIPPSFYDKNDTKVVVNGFTKVHTHTLINRGASVLTGTVYQIISFTHKWLREAAKESFFTNGPTTRRGTGGGGPGGRPDQ